LTFSPRKVEYGHDIWIQTNINRDDAGYFSKSSTFREDSLLPGFILSLREGLETALILGIVLGALRKTGHKELSPIVWAGGVTAMVLSLAAALILYGFGASLSGNAEPIFEGTTLFLAAGVLTWMIFWMSRQSRTIKTELEAGVRQAISRPGKGALFLLIFLSVAKEGIELAIFLIATILASGSQQTLAGAAIGLSVSALLGWFIFASTIRLNLGRFFQVTGALLILFAAGLVTLGVHEFIEVGWIPAGIQHVWDMGALISESSIFGMILKSLFGYTANPSLTEVLAYIAYFAAIAISLRFFNTPAASAQKV
jgi:high-affinity iron transporter